jgi:hypothetical protein
MSMTKNSAAFDRMMEEARQEQENSYLLYLEERYLRERESNTTNDPKGHYIANPPKGTNPKDQ